VQNTCSSFTNISGFFGSQPTVTWDESIQGYVLFGTAANGTLWRSTFTASGVFNNNWTQLDGSSVSPPGAASRTQASWASYTATEDSVTLTGVSIFNLHSLALDAIAGGAGWYQCTATGMASFSRASTVGDNVAFLALSTTSASFDTSKWTAVDVPPGSPTGLTSIPISVTRWFNASTSPLTVYAVAWRAGSNAAPIYIRQTSMHCNYHRL
jgi:hypothetical protein